MQPRRNVLYSMRHMLATLLIVVAVLLLAGCPRRYPEGAAPELPRGTHPWDSPTYRGPELAIMEQLEQERAQPDQQAVEEVNQRGPAFPAEDTLIEQQIAGNWLTVAASANEQQNLLPPGEQDVWRMAANGDVVFRAYSNWQESVLEGSWTKLRPGVVGISFNNAEPTEFHGQLFDNDFLYLWHYPSKSGFWMVRLPEQVTGQIGANRFATNRGELHIQDVVGQSYSGTVSGQSAITVSGFYNRGVLSMRWEQDDRTGTGFAAFLPGQDWSTLRGVWWLDDYEAAPFGAPWTGEAQ